MLHVSYVLLLYVLSVRSIVDPSPLTAVEEGNQKITRSNPPLIVSCRNAEKEFVAETDAIEPGTEWERIAKLCDFNPKSSKTSRDVSRMRSIILQLKQNPIQTTARA